MVARAITKAVSEGVAKSVIVGEFADSGGSAPVTLTDPDTGISLTDPDTGIALTPV